MVKPYKILVGITGYTDDDWNSKLEELDKFKISEAALFLERFTKPQRRRLYKALSDSDVKNLPLAHIRNDMKKDELIFLAENFGSHYFTIHEDSFRYLEKWRGFYKHLFLEMNAKDCVSASVDVDKIGGFCIDLSHFKRAECKKTKEFEYVMARKGSHRFACNHLNGYSYKDNIDMHFVRSLKDFDYLKTLPRFLFGRVIALETDNGISEQLRFKEHLESLLSEQI